MPKDVIITPANSYMEFRDTNSNVDAMIYLDNSRNLNIQNPNGSLTFGNTAANVYIGDGTSVVDIIFEQNGSVRALTGKTLTLGQSDSSVAFAGNVTNGFRVTSGNVGIGTTTPLALLDVRGNVYFGGADTGPNFIAFRGTTSDGPGSYNHTYIGERIWQAATEKSELFIFKGNDISGPSGPDRVRIGANEFRVDTFLSALSGDFETVANSALLTTKFIVEGTGNVGIATTTPTSNLHVIGTANVSANLTVGAGSAAAPALTTAGDNNTGIFFPAADTIALTEGGTEVLRVTSTSNVAIGTTAASYKVDVTGDIRASGNMISVSDLRTKQNVQTIGGALKKVVNLRGVYFNRIGSNTKHIGVIAQEVNEILPEVVSYTENEDRYSVAYGNMVGILIEAIKEQNEKIVELENKLNQIKTD